VRRGWAIVTALRESVTPRLLWKLLVNAAIPIKLAG
jgi:hypothetical protein